MESTKQLFLICLTLIMIAIVVATCQVNKKSTIGELLENCKQITWNGRDYSDNTNLQEQAERCRQTVLEKFKIDES